MKLRNGKNSAEWANRHGAPGGNAFFRYLPGKKLTPRESHHAGDADEVPRAHQSSVTASFRSGRGWNEHTECSDRHRTASPDIQSADDDSASHRFLLAVFCTALCRGSEFFSGSCRNGESAPEFRVVAGRIGSDLQRRRQKIAYRVCRP